MKNRWKLTYVVEMEGKSWEEANKKAREYLGGDEDQGKVVEFKAEKVVEELFF